MRAADLKIHKTNDKVSTRGRVYFLSRTFAFSFNVCCLTFANTRSLISTPDLSRPSAQIRRWRKSEKKLIFFRMGNCMCYYQQTRPWYFNLFTKSASCSLLKETHFLCLHFSFSSWKFASSIIKRQKIETGICFLSLTFRSVFFWFLLLIFPFFSKRSIIPVVLFSKNPWSGYHWYNCRSVYQLAWENSRHWSRDATTTQSFPAKWRPRNKFPTFHIDDPDQASASGWLKTENNLQPIRNMHYQVVASRNVSCFLRLCINFHQVLKISLGLA